MDSSAETFGNGASLPLVVGLNCLEDCRFEQEALKGIAIVRHVELSRLAEGGIEKATAVLLHSLAYLPRAAQRLLKGWQIILCLGSTDKAADSVLASDLGLQLLHVDTGRAEEVADTVMALILGLLRHTHVLSKQGMSSSGWLGSLLPLCRGMHRCSGLVLGIIGRSASAFALAARSLAFKMRVLYIDMDQIMYQTMGKSTRHRRSFPAAAKQMDTLNDLLSASDVVSLHCAVTNETPQILNAETLQHIKPGAFIVNASSSHLVDDCVLKQLLIDGTVAGCALDGVEGPQWMEAWVKEMPNVLILPRSADYSEEVWMEIREKAILILHAYFIEGVFPENAVSDDNCDVNSGEDATRGRKAAKEDSHISTQDSEVFDDIRHGSPEYCQKQTSMLPQAHSLQTLDSSMSLESGGYREVRHGRSGKKGKKRSGHHKSQQKTDLSILLGQETNFVALQRDDHGASVSGRDQMISSSSHITSPDAARNKCCLDSTSTVDTSEKQSVISVGPFDQNGDLLKDGLVISMHSKDPKGYHVSRRKSPLGGWILDTIVNITKRDPAAQFLIVCPRKGRIGLRSFAAGGKLLQVNSRGELVFASHNFDAWDSWILEGSTLGACRLINSRNRLVSLDISIEILAAVSEEDGIARWLS